MAEIRAIVTVAVTANFAGIGAPTQCAPLLYETTTGDLYALLSPDTVVLVGSVAGGSSHLLAGQAFGKHLVPEPQDKASADTQLAAQVFARQFSPPASTDDASTHLSSRAFDRAIPGATDLRQLLEVLSAQVFARTVVPLQAVLGDASDIIASRAFGPKQLPPAMWS